MKSNQSEMSLPSSVYDAMLSGKGRMEKWVFIINSVASVIPLGCQEHHLQWRSPPLGVPWWLIKGKIPVRADYFFGFPGGSVVKNPPANAGDTRSVPRWGRSLAWEDPSGERNSNPLLYSFLGNSMGRKAFWATVHGVTKSWAQLSRQAQQIWRILMGDKVREKSKAPV